jgi:hypothetical protein
MEKKSFANKDQCFEISARAKFENSKQMKRFRSRFGYQMKAYLFNSLLTCKSSCYKLSLWFYEHLSAEGASRTLRTFFCLFSR